MGYVYKDGLPKKKKVKVVCPYCFKVYRLDREPDERDRAACMRCGKTVDWWLCDTRRYDDYIAHILSPFGTQLGVWVWRLVVCFFAVVYGLGTAFKEAQRLEAQRLDDEMRFVLGMKSMRPIASWPAHYNEFTHEWQWYYKKHIWKRPRD